MDIEQIYQKGLAGKEETSFTIVGSRIYQYVNCPTEFYLNYFGPAEKKLPDHEFILKLIEKGLLHEEDVCSKINLLPIIFEDLKKGFKETLQAMKSGIKLIRHPILFHLEEDFMCIPDLLEKNDSHQSIFGNYHYTVSDIKLAKHAKEKYIMQIMFYNYILGKIQDYTPKEACLILGKEEEKVYFKFEDYWPKLKEHVGNMKKILKGEEPSPVISSRCKMCPWREHCLEIALKTEDVSLVWRLGGRIKETLAKHGIKTLTDLVKADINQLSKLTGLNNLEQLQMQAKALKHGKRFVIKKPELPKKHELIFDMEKYDEEQKEWLIGVMEDGKIKQFIAYKPEEEKKIWAEFKEYLTQKKDYTLYYYGSYEKTAIKRLSKVYGINKKLKKEIQKNLVDIYSVLTGSVILPLHSNSLKNVAKHFGFKWTENLDAAGSMCLYEKWLKDGNKEHLEKALRYNKEDLLATKKVLEFLKNL